VIVQAGLYRYLHMLNDDLQGIIKSPNGERLIGVIPDPIDPDTFSGSLAGELTPNSATLNLTSMTFTDATFDVNGDGLFPDNADLDANLDAFAGERCE
jgi:hypothetical protein